MALNTGQMLGQPSSTKSEERDHLSFDLLLSRWYNQSRGGKMVTVPVRVSEELAERLAPF
jgi:hypothetical protein